MEPIAIVGMGCVFPGADSPDAFWTNLLTGSDTTSLATADDMGVDPAVLYHPERGQRDRYSSLRGGYYARYGMSDRRDLLHVCAFAPGATVGRVDGGT